ncbi:MAG: prepilin-type N-terminal cleavage/methylation domain-containing protein [Planctomycetes bacterium]|nr:prepilin-type N-terminal cleavage/methylation domain-containing protein [Planctomycetota bacterium]
MTRARRNDAERSAGGFTLLELVIVMGILSAFLVMLVQLVGLGLDLFAEGEVGQLLADRGVASRRVLSDELALLRGSANGRDREAVEDRLVVQLLPIGLPADPERGATLVQVVRAAVQLPPARELELVDGELALRARAAEPELSDTELLAKVAEMRATTPLRGIGNMLLVPWRQEGSDDALLELRAAWFLPGQTVIVRDMPVDPFAVAVPGSPALPGVTVLQNIRPILQNLLHCEFAFWSQATVSWTAGAGAVSGGPGPEQIWDSARGGWLIDDESGGTFAFDRGPASRSDPTDDIHPHAIRVLCVAAQPPELPAEGLLGARIGPDENGLRVLDGDRFPGPETGGYVKIHGEWIYYAKREGDRLTGLRRGQRRTKALEHPAGSRVHVGTTVEFVIPIPHHKDDYRG